MHIGQLAAEIGVSSKAIRFYEDTGILPPAARAENGYRIYGPTAVDRLRFVKDAQSAGLTLKEISTILELRDQGKGTCNHTMEMLDGHLHDVERQIEELYRTRDRLVDMMERAKGLDPADCNDPNRCQTISG